MATRRALRERDLFDNPSPRLPIALVLDVSMSMSGETRWGAPVQQTDPSPIDELNRGVKLFFEQIGSDEVAASSAEIAVITYSGKANLLTPFASIERQEIPELATEGGGTNIGSAVQLARAQLQRRKQEYQRAGVDYFQPWLVLMTDGMPTHGPHESEAKETRAAAGQKKLVVFPVGVGTGADMDLLASFSPPERGPMSLEGLRFTDFFVWLSQSVQMVSQSMPGEGISLPPPTWSTDKPDRSWNDVWGFRFSEVPQSSPPAEATQREAEGAMITRSQRDSGGAGSDSP